MPLQDNCRGIFVACRGRGDEDYVAGLVLMAFQSQPFPKRRTPVADGFRVGGAVGNGAQLLKDFKYPLRFQT